MGMGFKNGDKIILNHKKKIKAKPKCFLFCLATVWFIAFTKIS